MKTFDVIIAGAGPGGLGAALKASALGMKTALLERHSTLNPVSRACSEGILYDEYYFGDSVSIEKGAIHFNENRFSMAYTGPIRDVPYFMNVSRGGGRMKLVREGGLPIHLVFDKSRYLEENLERAIAAGTSYFPEQNVSAVESGSQGVIVRTDTDSFRAPYLIAADGHNSSCARFAGFNSGRTFYGTLTAACWHITGFEPEEPGHIHLIEGSGEPSVFCICPAVAEGSWSVVISGFDRNTDFERRFEQVQKNSVLSGYFKTVRILRRSACILNLQSPIPDPCGNNVFVIGDGAWFGQTSNTHAALTGMKAADCIGRALRENVQGDGAYEPYRSWWTENFVQYLNVPGGANMFELLSAAELDELFSYMPREIVASMEPKKCGQLLGAFLQRLMPEIQKKSPALVHKIVAIQQQDQDKAWEHKRQAGFPIHA